MQAIRRRRNRSSFKDELFGGKVEFVQKLLRRWRLFCNFLRSLKGGRNLRGIAWRWLKLAKPESCTHPKAIHLTLARLLPWNVVSQLLREKLMPHPSWCYLHAIDCSQRRDACLLTFHAQIWHILNQLDNHSTLLRALYDTCLLLATSM